MAQGRVNREDDGQPSCCFSPKTAAHSRHCRGEETNHRCSSFLVVFFMQYRVIFSAPSNEIVDSQFVQEEQIPCAQFQ